MGSKLIPLALLAGLCLATVVQQVSAKVDCHPLNGASKEKCESLGCVWSPVTKETHNSDKDGLSFDASTISMLPEHVDLPTGVQEPWCYFPDDYVGYKVTDESKNLIKLSRARPSALPNDIQELHLEMDFIGANNNQLRVKIYDPNNKRFVPDLPELDIAKPKRNLDEALVQVEVEKGRHLVIRRTLTGAELFRTDIAQLIFADQFIQMNTRISSQYVYGLGEHYGSFLKKTDDWKTYTFFHTDRLPLPGGMRSYGSFPFYINLDADMKHAHGVYLRSSDPMDIILQPDQSITYRVIGGILDFIVVVGREPNDVVAQFQKIVGLPQLPPLWSLGFHLCRYNYNTLEKTKQVTERTKAAGIPFDVQWNDIDYMDRHNDFTYDNNNYRGLPEFVDSLHKSNMHYVILFDPGLSQEDNYYPYQLGLQMDVFIKNATNQTLVGKVWNDSGRTVFPDFSNPKSHDYWTELFVKFHQELPFDGAWIDMNDISNFVDGSLEGCPSDNKLEQPPYIPGGDHLQRHTLCLSAKHQAGYEYDVHNLYSFYEAIATYKAMLASRPNKRPFILSRSSSPGQGFYGGHWSGDVLSTWDYLRWSIPSLIEHSMYGYSLMGSDICGFTGNTNPELCARWSTLGAFYTFTRNHNDDKSIDQDPVALGQDVIDANKFALTKRYSLLPFLYSLIHRAHLYGEPIVRAMPFEFFSTDNKTLEVEHQFMWGKALLISPVVDQGAYSKKTYLPAGRWYETNVKPTNQPGPKVPKLIDSKGEWVLTEDIALSDIPLFYRGGHIVPMYTRVGSTIAETMANQPTSLEVALCDEKMAYGELFVDDGDSVEEKVSHLTMSFNNNRLLIILGKDDYAPEVKIGRVDFFGFTDKVKGIRANNHPLPFEQHDHLLTFDLGGMSVSKGNNLVVKVEV